MREKNIESKLAAEVRRRGGWLPSLSAPDSTVSRQADLLRRQGSFAELKAPGKTLRPLQAVRKRQLEALGFRVYVIDSIEQIGGVLNELSAP